MTGPDAFSPADRDELLAFATMSKGPGRQGALAMPTICPWTAVPRTVPSTSTVIPDGGR